jgi:predicted flap endonuclease-1-like 5' DNA nuclease
MIELPKIELLIANWPAVAVTLALLLALLWIMQRGRRSRTRDRHRAPDALDEGASPATRNQALIDAPSAVTAANLADTGPDIFGGIGGLLAVGAGREVEASAPTPASTPASTPEPGVDDLSRIKGIGPKLVTLLGQLGVTSFAQIAVWTEADIDRIDAQLGVFAGRIRRDSWVEQAKFLAAGDTVGFEGKYGKV